MVYEPAPLGGPLWDPAADVGAVDGALLPLWQPASRPSDSVAHADSVAQVASRVVTDFATRNMSTLEPTLA